jgi:hypothetical protein
MNEPEKARERDNEGAGAKNLKQEGISLTTTYSGVAIS